MYRPSLPSTPLPGTPTLRIPTPVRTPSPLPLYSGGGPYSYSGQISRKYASRFNQIKATKDNVKNAEEAWEKEAQEKGTDIEGLVKSMETNYDWKKKSVAEVEYIKPQGEIVLEEVGKGKEEGEGEQGEQQVVENNKRLSLDEDQFVDALQSPMREKSKEYEEMMSDHEI